MDTAIQNYARTLTLRSPDHYRVGPFTVRHNPSWELKFANYAIPDQDAEPTARDIADLVAAFRAHDRLPRLEFLPAWAPAVEPALLAAGFTVENRAPVLACTADGLLTPEPVDGLHVAEPVTDDEFTSAAAVQHTGFGGEGGPDDGEIAWLRGATEGGGVSALATVDGLPAGAGGCSVPVDGIGELAGLAVAGTFRRRGVGAALSAWLTRTAFERGFHAVWLEPGGPDVERIYAGIGYRRTGEKLNISLDPA
ncbi:GNAT family N-acetyltransferase [Streptomyces sp. NPDC057067]|uniref:GNAT family N-acetyltransferase n=3 Tax=Streptomyces TaxID=1883 RepID=A0AAU1LWE3_9ACTN|nr:MULTISPECIES: GNAT family N-acetyltransferase [Streptomyces]WSS70754.1 GNAT family N-acetyltransferase [Streptomyces sp. NBC_01175]MBL1288273.1 GNAT family N-acetyltransferase [Streptomyces silvae]MDX3323198.1 GNAT family N-acetyltransferase [Streptomyces sp. ME02-6979-3A]MDX3682495.1 GNAT family N-acetyltransferase [Streptomyces sp. AK04-4c]TXS26963.1 GNAT family N-acetyltransferase [Streptomyces sp. gb1(2016)]